MKLVELPTYGKDKNVGKFDLSKFNSESAHPLFPSGWDAGLHGALVFESPLFGIATNPGLEPGLGLPGLR